MNDHLPGAGSSPLSHQANIFVNFRNGTYQWVHIKLFRVPDPSPADRVLLELLLSHPRYRDAYLGAGDGEEAGPIHGPYSLPAISPDSFARVEAAPAEALLRGWAEEHAPLPAAVSESLDRDLYPRIRNGTSRYQLRNLGAEAFHEVGWILGEFHELVVIDRVGGTLALVVASAD
ncbi:hypothetical protein [Streptoalloteichus hindustanus]|uniref:Uncharacterized protein n=1 Tax=Streptoalloteichus hindustanus TaxID=2017 RepID=A0A1M5F539_STRHI|nr:hypothetical protein [Streptoalloteichus hindustanus]SHF86664.1 hypothetical protein SAMN05444320_105279 [Streptoalloteichus hindustanus]